MIGRIGQIGLIWLDAAEAEVIAGRSDFAFTAGSYHVASAVAIATQERSTPVNPLLLVWFHRIVTLRGSLRILRYLTA